jgi:cold shock CspA family protein
VTGTITELKIQRRFGSIRAGDGATFTFYDSDVIAEQFSLLKIGQVVSFEAGRGSQQQNAVRVQSEIGSSLSVAAPHGEKLLGGSRASSQAEAWRFLYAGFDHPSNMRRYKFSAVARSQPTKLLTVSVDLALFLKHHVGIQEAPAMCLHKLSGSDLQAAQVQYELTDGDLAAYVAERAAAAARKIQQRRWPKLRRLTSPPRQ